MALPPLTLRATKGAALTADEFDDNHLRHEQRVDGIEASLPAAIAPTNVVQNGHIVTFHFSDGSSWPVTLPQAAPSAPVRATVTAATFTPALTDSGLWIPINHAAGCVVSLPLAADVAFPIRTTMMFDQTGAGAITFSEATDDPTILYPNTALPQTAEQYAVVGVKLVAADTWRLFGDMAALEGTA